MSAGLFSTMEGESDRNDEEDAFDRRARGSSLEYNKTRIHRNTKQKRRELALVEDWRVDEAVGAGLECLFRDGKHFPADPFKCLLHVMRRRERAVADLPRPVASVDVPRHYETPQSIDSDTGAFRLTKFRRSAAVGLVHLTKLCDPSGIQALEVAMVQLRAQLGGLPSHVERQDSRLHFVEVALVDGLGALSRGLATPRAHALTVHVEGIVQGPKLDTCLVLFIRRVFEEIDQASQSQDLLTSACQVLSGSGKLTKFVLKDIMGQKELVLSTLKSAILDGGSISLDMYLRTQRALPTELYSEKSGVTDSENDGTVGFIKVRRVYRFSYRWHAEASANNKDKDAESKSKERKGSRAKEGKSRYRCFSGNPLDSLVRGVFFSQKEATLYTKACTDHSRHQNSSDQSEQSSGQGLSKAARKKLDEEQDLALLASLTKQYCRHILRHFEDGQFTSSAIWMLITHAFLASSGIKVDTGKRGTADPETLDSHMHIPEHAVVRVVPSFCQRQLRSLTTGVTGRAHAIVEAVRALLGGIRLLTTEDRVEAMMEAAADTEVTPEQVLARTRAREELRHMYDSVLQALSEVRLMLLALHRDLPSLVSSDGSSVLNLMLDNVSSLFHKRFLSRPVLPVFDVLLRKHVQGGAGPARQEALRNLKLLLPPLLRIEAGLVFLGSSTAADAVLELLQMDTDAFHRYKTKYKKNTQKRIDKGKLADGRPRLLSYSLSIAPMTFSDILGYSMAAVSSTNSRDDTWHAYLPRLMTRNLLDRNHPDYFSPDFSRNLSLSRSLALDELLMSEAACMTVDRPRRLSALQRAVQQEVLFSQTDIIIPDTVELLSALQGNSTGRLGVVDGSQSCSDELQRRHEVPTCVAGETVKLRYLAETLALPALEEAYFEMMNAPEATNVFVHLCNTLSRYSARLQLWQNLDEDVVMLVLAHVLRPPSVPPARPAVHRRLGFHKIPLGRYKDKLHGGLVGLPGVIDFLFTNWKVVYANMWSIPPIIANAPRSTANGVAMTAFCGVAVETALRWGLVETSVFPIRSEPKSPKPAAQPFIHLVRETDKERQARLQTLLQSAKEKDKSSAENRDRSRRPLMLPNTDLWAVTYPGKSYLEVVYKATHDVPTQVPIIRTMFAKQVEECFRQLTKSPAWRVQQIRVPVSGQVNGVITTREVKFSASRLAVDPAYVATMASRIAKAGVVFMDAAGVVNDASGEKAGGSHGGIMSFEDLMTVLSGQGSLYADDDAAGVSRPPGGEAAMVIDRDPTRSDVERLVEGSNVSNSVARVARQQGAASIYVPISIHFSLLASIRGISVPSSDTKKKEPLADLLAAEKAALTIGEPAVVSRLLCSTVWASREAGDEVWSCARQVESRQNCVLYEAESHLETARVHGRAHNLVSAYEQLGVAALIGGDYNAAQDDEAVQEVESPWGKCFEVVPAMLRMRCSLAGKLQRLIDCVDMVRWILSSAAEAGRGVGVSDGFSSLDYTALATTLTRHVNLTLRLIVMAPQCTHLRGGCFLLLRRILQLEEILRLGRLPLTAGHLYVQSGGYRDIAIGKSDLKKSRRFSMSGKFSTSGSNLNTSSKSLDTSSAPQVEPISQLPGELPIPLMDLGELQELKQENLDIDPLGMFRRAFAAQKKSGDEESVGAYQLLTDISNMSHVLMQALATDVHRNESARIHDLLLFSSQHRILHPDGQQHTCPPDAEEVAPALAVGVPTVRATHWQRTKSALLFIARNGRMDKATVDRQAAKEKEVAAVAAAANRPVITAKMALQQNEPSTNLVFLKKKFRDVKHQVAAVRSLQTFSSGESAARRHQEKERAQEQQREREEQQELLFGGLQTGSVDDLGRLGAELQLGMETASVMSDITAPDYVGGGNIEEDDTSTILANQQLSQPQIHASDERAESLAHGDVQGQVQAQDHSEDRKLELKQKQTDEEHSDQGLVSLPSAVSVPLPDSLSDYGSLDQQGQTSTGQQEPKIGLQPRVRRRSLVNKAFRIGASAGGSLSGRHSSGGREESKATMHSREATRDQHFEQQREQSERRQREAIVAAEEEAARQRQLDTEAAQKFRREKKASRGSGGGASTGKSMLDALRVK